MSSEQERYQNLLTQMHELNRQNLLNENEKIEQVSHKIDSLNKNISKLSSNTKDTNNKLLILILVILLINTLLLSYIVFTNYKSNNKDINNQNTKVSKVIEEVRNNPEKETNDEDVLSFNKEVIETFEDEKFSEIKPLIRKGTSYTCKNDNNKYKIPYTVEIKGKLFPDRFMFILQEDSVTKECSIKKENM